MAPILSAFLQVLKIYLKNQNLQWLAFIYARENYNYFDYSNDLRPLMIM